MDEKIPPWTACFATSTEPVVERVAVEEMRTSFRSLFDNIDLPINAASLLPGLLENFGDLEDVFGEISPRKILLAASIGPSLAGKRYVEAVAGRFTSNPKTLLNWSKVRAARLGVSSHRHFFGNERSPRRIQEERFRNPWMGELA